MKLHRELEKPKPGAILGVILILGDILSNFRLLWIVRIVYLTATKMFQVQPQDTGSLKF